MHHPALQRDGVKLRETRQFSGSAQFTTLSVFDHFSAPLQCTNLCNTDDYSPIPTHLKLESGIHDFSSCLPEDAQDGTGDGKDHSEFPACSPEHQRRDGIFTEGPPSLLVKPD